MKKRYIAALIILIVLFSCVACNNYVEQNVVVKGWLKDSADFDLGRFMVEIETHITNEEQLGFRIKDDRAFTEVVLKHNKLLRKEYNNKQNTVYVFLNEGNYFLLISNGSKGANYILRSAVSVFTDKDGTQYFFPFYDCQIFYNGMLFFDENRRFGLFCGSAMETSPLTVSTRLPASLTILPSRTLRRLKTGMESTLASLMVWMS